VSEEAAQSLVRLTQRQQGLTQRLRRLAQRTQRAKGANAEAIEADTVDVKSFKGFDEKFCEAN